MPLEIALVEPEIPANTGNVARTCVATGTRLHLCGRLGFDIGDKRIKRAGLDYWYDLELRLWDSAEALLRAYRGAVFYATTKAERLYTEVDYPEDCLLMFGKETAGLPESLLLAHPERCVRIPMLGAYRSLNLSNSVAIICYEALRQRAFAGMNLRSSILAERRS